MQLDQVESDSQVHVRQYSLDCRIGSEWVLQRSTAPAGPGRISGSGNRNMYYAFFLPGFHGDGATYGKSDGTAYEFVHHLFEAGFISMDQPAWFYKIEQFRFWFFYTRTESQHGIHHGFQFEGAEGQFYIGVLKTGVIKDIIDHAMQLASSVCDLPQVFIFCCVSSRYGYHGVCHRDDGLERRL